MQGISPIDKVSSASHSKKLALWECKDHKRTVDKENMWTYACAFMAHSIQVMLVGDLTDL